MNYGISFIGTGNYQPITYQYNSEQIDTTLFPYAFCHFFNLNKLFLVMTKEAKDKHYETLKSLICDNKKDCCIEEINIPSGKNEDELWKIFDIIADTLPDNSKISFDITHAFRSQPFMAIAICNYLSIIKNILIVKVVYGAYEASENGIAPVFDLTPFLELIRWSNAVNQFIKFGNSKELRDILININKLTHKNDHSMYKAFELGSFGEKLNSLTNSLAITRIDESTRYSNELARKLDSIKSDINNIPRIKPFGLLLDKIVNRFQEIFLVKENLFSNSGFKAQIKMIEFYLETEQYMQAITLAREVIVSRLAVEKGLEPKKRENRENIESYLWEVKNKFEKKNASTEQEKEVGRLWSSITQIRNDIDHAGMNKNPIRTSRAIKNVTRLCKEVISYINKSII